MMINTDLIACVQRTGPPTIGLPTKGCTFFLANGGQLNADGADYEQIKNLLGFSTDGEAPGDN